MCEPSRHEQYSMDTDFVSLAVILYTVKIQILSLAGIIKLYSIDTDS
jgi:hypothetical protein